MSINESLKKVRTENNYTQTKLAEKLNISPQSISKWEKGLATPSIQDLIKLADLYDISLDTLVGHLTTAQKNASLGFDEFCNMLCQKYKNNLNKAYALTGDYLDRTLSISVKSDVIWDIGGRNLILGAVLYLLNDNNVKTFGRKDVLHLLELDTVSENRQEHIAEKFKDVPNIIQTCVAGCVDSHSATFRGYISVAAEQLHKLSK